MLSRKSTTRACFKYATTKEGHAEGGAGLPRGKKYNDDVREKALALLTVNNNVNSVAKELGIPEATVRGWRKKAEGDSDGEFAKARALKKGEFVNRAWQVIGLGMQVLEKRLHRALFDEFKIDALSNEALLAEGLGVGERKRIASKLDAIRVEDVAKVSAVIGTLFDKQAIANGDEAKNEKQTVTVIFANPEDAEYAE